MRSATCDFCGKVVWNNAGSGQPDYESITQVFVGIVRPHGDGVAARDELSGDRRYDACLKCVGAAVDTFEKAMKGRSVSG